MMSVMFVVLVHRASLNGVYIYIRVLPPSKFPSSSWGGYLEECIQSQLARSCFVPFVGGGDGDAI